MNIKISYIYASTLFAFYIANIYQCPAHKYLQLFKWGMLLVLFISLYLRNYKQIRLTKWNYILFFFLLFSFFTVFNSISIKGSFIKSLTFIFLFLISYEIRNYLFINKLKITFFKPLLVLSCVIVLPTVILYFLGINLGRNPAGRYSMWVDNSNTLGMMIFPLVPVTMYFICKAKSKIAFFLLIILGLLQFYLLYLTGSRASTLAVMTAFAVFIFNSKYIKKYKNIFYIYFILIISIFSISLFYLPRSSIDKILPLHQETYEKQNIDISHYSLGLLLLSGREGAWKVGFQEIINNPVYGTGAGTEKIIVRNNHVKMPNHNGEYLHNSFLASFVEYGLLGGGLIIIIFLFPLFYLIRIFFCRNHNYNIEFITLLAIYLSCLINAFFESWLLSIGNLNILIFWPILLILLDAKKYKSEFTIKTNT